MWSDTCSLITQAYGNMPKIARMRRLLRIIMDAA